MTTFFKNHRLKKIFIASVMMLAVLSFMGNVSADHEKDLRKAIQASPRTADLVKLGYDKKSAENAIYAVVSDMENSQNDIKEKYSEMEDRVNSMPSNDTRRDPAKKLLKSAKKAGNSFTGISAVKNIVIKTQIGNVPPLILPGDDFSAKKQAAEDALIEVNKILIAPVKPGSVPEGDILEDFIPQFIRQLFRFAWAAVFIAFVVSGVYFIIAMDSEEQLSAAKRMIYYTLIGFAFVALAFAIVKAITDINFFGFI
jgi:hypothetical protein